VRAHGTPVTGVLDDTCVRFERPQPRVAPGQVVALYDSDTLLGGGIAS
jgi:tRNA U34 2-thiouridine synthase MnmA/TrmU